MKNISSKWLIYALVFSLVIIIILIFLPKRKNNLVINDFKAPLIEVELDSFDIVEGESEGNKLALIIYENYLDLFSLDLQSTLKQVKDEFSDDLLFIYRPFIGQEIEQQEASLLVICAQKYNQGRKARELVYSQGRDNFSLDNLDNYNLELSLNNNELEICLNDENNFSSINSWQSELIDRDIIGSPTIIINDEIITGARPYYDFIDSNEDSIEGLRSIIVRHLNN